MVNKFTLSHLDRMIPKQEVRDENIKQNNVDNATAAAFFCFCSINKNKQLYKRSNIGKRKIKVISNCHEEEIKNKIKEENKKKNRK